MLGCCTIEITGTVDTLSELVCSVPFGRKLLWNDTIFTCSRYVHVLDLSADRNVIETISKFRWQLMEYLKKTSCDVCQSTQILIHVNLGTLKEKEVFYSRSKCYISLHFFFFLVQIFIRLFKKFLFFNHFNFIDQRISG